MVTRELMAAPLAPWASARARQRIAELTDQHQEQTVCDVAAAVSRESATQLDCFETDGLGLYAGSNVLSPAVLDAHEGALASRPALGWPGEKVQPGLDGIEALEVIAAQQLRRAFGAEHVEARFVTATLANLAAYIAFTEPGDTIAVLSPEAGGHASHHAAGTAGVRGLRVEYLPFDVEALEVDRSSLDDFMRAVRPKLLLVGGSVIQFPTDLVPLREAADKHSAKLVFDASHVAGLIAGGAFPNPLAEGVDLMTFSTYKTLAGPAGGCAVTDIPEVAELISHAVYPVLTSNYDAARLGPLAIAAAEAAEQSPPWAAATVELAVDVAERLAAEGFPLQGADRGYTESHQIAVDVSSFGGGIATMRRLERCRIYVGACRLAAQNADSPPAGIRLGTQEIVRLGAKESHASELARTIARAIRGEQVDGRLVRESFGIDLWGRQQA